MFTDKDFIFWDDKSDALSISQLDQFEDELYPDSYLKTLSFIGPIKNHTLLRDSKNYPKAFEEITQDNVL